MFVVAESFAAEADVDLHPGREGRRERRDEARAVVAGFFVSGGQEREEGRERRDEALAIVVRGRRPVPSATMTPVGPEKKLTIFAQSD